MTGTRRLTALQALPALDSGGVERGTLEIAHALVEAGERSIVVSAGGRLVGPLVAAGSEHVGWAIGAKSPLTLRLVKRLRKLLETEQVDIVHARSRVPAWIAWLAWRQMPPVSRPRFLTTVHGLYSVGPYSEIMTRGECVIVGSRTAREYVLRNYPRTPPGRVRLIPRGVSRHEFPAGHRPAQAWHRAWCKRFPELTGRRVLTLVGRITRLKGHADLLGLLERLRGRAPDVRGLVVGGEDPRRGRYARALYSEARARNLPVTFTGHRDDVRDIYAVSDVVLSLSGTPESFGRAVLEALSVGVPVVGYDHGGVGEILRAIYPAGLSPVGDVDRLAERVGDVLERRAKVPVNHPFTLEHMQAQTLATYRELAAERRSWCSAT